MVMRFTKRVVGRVIPCAPFAALAQDRGAHGVTRPTSTGRFAEHGALMTEAMVAVAILVIAIFPLAFSFAQEHRFLRACYFRAVAMEVVDGETEVLLAGEWRNLREGTQDYAPRGAATANLPPGKFQLTLTGRRLRLEWLPRQKDRGGKVVREVTVK